MLRTGITTLIMLTLAAPAAQGRFASFVPVNVKAYRLHTPDGEERLFVRDAEEPNFLQGEGDWVAELEGRRALVMKDVEDESDREGYMFLGGYLVKQLSGGVEKDFEVPAAGGDEAALAALWPAKDARLVAANPPDIWSEGERLRLWFPNPNLAGALFAELSLAALLLFAFRPLVVKVIASLLSLAAFAGLLMTSSRGALVGFLAGLASIVLVRLGALLRPKRILLIFGALAVAACCLYATGQVERMTKNLFNEQAQETSRVKIWREVPRMMADAPGGWGWGESARAYIDWYQPANDCLLKNLISGHLTLLVENGWPVRFGYVFLWLFAVLMAFAAARRGASPAPLAILVAFGVASVFNPVISAWELWIVPVVACAVLAVCVRRCVPCRARGLVFAISAVLAALICAGVFAWGRIGRKDCVQIRKIGGGVCLNGATPETWLVDDDYTLHGGYWWLLGRSIRDSFERGSRTSALGVARSLADVPNGVRTLVLVGESGLDWLNAAGSPTAEHVVLLSPPFNVQRIPDALRKDCDVSVVAGDLAYRLGGGEYPAPKEVRLVPGAELYIPGWMRYVP